MKGSSDGGGFDALFDAPYGLALDGSGNLYVADVLNRSIRKGSPLTDRAMIDTNSGLVGVARQLWADPQTATSWRWDVIRRPAGSLAQLSSASIPDPTFVPDVGDTFVFRLTASRDTGTTVTHVRLTSKSVPRRRVVAHSD